MENRITAEGTLFVLEHPLDGRGKWLFALHALLFIIPAFGFIYLISAFGPGSVVELLIPLGLVGGCSVIAFRYFVSAWRKDTLLITTNEIILTEQKGFQNKQHTFLRSGITAIRFLEKPELTPHPLAGKTFDYLGLQVQDQVINEMFGDHRVAFDYEGQTISFGRKLFSWDYEAIREVLFGEAEQKEQELPWNVEASHEDYWAAYDAFVETIRLEQQYIREAVDNARKYVNALEDGWDEHRDSLKELLVRYEDQFTRSQQQQLAELIAEAAEQVRGK